MKIFVKIHVLDNGMKYHINSGTSVFQGDHQIDRIFNEDSSSDLFYELKMYID